MGDPSNVFICGISSSYFMILLFATVCSCRCAPKPRQLDSLEEEYLRRMEEGFIKQINSKEA
jgi:hypothetical protein